MRFHSLVAIVAVISAVLTLTVEALHQPRGESGSLIRRSGWRTGRPLQKRFVGAVASSPKFLTKLSQLSRNPQTIHKLLKLRILVPSPGQRRALKSLSEFPKLKVRPIP